MQPAPVLILDIVALRTRDKHMAHITYRYNKTTHTHTRMIRAGQILKHGTREKGLRSGWASAVHTANKDNQH